MVDLVIPAPLGLTGVGAEPARLDGNALEYCSALFADNRPLSTENMRSLVGRRQNALEVTDLVIAVIAVDMVYMKAFRDRAMFIDPHLAMKVLTEPHEVPAVSELFGLRVAVVCNPTIDDCLPLCHAYSLSPYLMSHNGRKPVSV